MPPSWAALLPRALVTVCAAICHPRDGLVHNSGISERSQRMRIDKA